MKYLYLILLSVSIQSFGQYGNYLINFDNNYGLEQLQIDTISNPLNIWEIGIPLKTLFDSAYSQPNAICTGLLDPYPPDDTSSFYIRNIAEQGFEQAHTVILAGKYRIDSDTLSDFGTIEFSPDNGQTWVNLLTDTIYRELGCYEWWSEEPVFTGNSNGWQEFYIGLAGFGYYFDIDMLQDTVIYKFTFISDSTHSDKDGWMLDDLHFEDWAEAIESNALKLFETIVSPNPSSELVSLSFSNIKHEVFQLSVFDINGARLLSKEVFDNQAQIDISIFNPGLFFYQLKNKNRISVGKFIKK